VWVPDGGSRNGPGSENATGPFFSPDGAWLAFDRDGALMKVSLAGGLSGVWADDGTIYFSAGTAGVIQRVPAGGGMPTSITTVRTADGEISHATPAQLPGGRSLPPRHHRPEAGVLRPARRAGRTAARGAPGSGRVVDQVETAMTVARHV
jgi:hypothetical protein